MNTRRLLQFFDQRREQQAPLALATVIATEGSTYSKAGARMLIDEHGIFQGMLSGGCLEGDLAIRAQQVIETSTAQLVTYDLGADDEELWGLGVGCDGLMKIQVQPLTAASNYEPFETIIKTLISEAPRLLILGGGLDAEPLVRFSEELGWYCTVVDHRPAYIAKGHFGSATTIICDGAGALLQLVNPAEFDAAIVMSHHLASDRAYLQALAETSIGYIGLLGPAGRRDRLLEDLGDAAQKLADRLQGPAGIDIGGQGPAAIALSIAAGLNQYLNGKRA